MKEGKVEFKDKPKSNNLSSEKLAELELVKTPEDLLSYMTKNIKYGFVGRNNNIFCLTEPVL
jgi:hypothetical protein